LLLLILLLSRLLLHLRADGLEDGVTGISMVTRTQVELQVLPHLLLLLSDKSLLMQHGCLLLLLCRNGSIIGQPWTGRV
jgi:hypothetical protein